jgi:hypothetical protein
VLVVPKILGHRQRRVAHAEPAARRLVHLAEDHHHVRQHAGFLHVAVKLLAFATTFADAAKNADALLVPDHVVDHLGEQHRLAHARPAEQPALPPRSSGISTSMTLMPVSKTSDLVERRPAAAGPDARCAIGRRGPFAVDGVAENVEHARENSLADRRLQRPARVFHRHAAGQALGGGQRNSTHAMRIQLRQHLDAIFPLRACSTE